MESRWPRIFYQLLQDGDRSNDSINPLKHPTGFAPSRFNFPRSSCAPHWRTTGTCRESSASTGETSGEHVAVMLHNCWPRCANTCSRACKKMASHESCRACLAPERAEDEKMLHIVVQGNGPPNCLTLLKINRASFGRLASRFLAGCRLDWRGGWHN